MKDNKSLIFTGIGVEALFSVLFGFWAGEKADHFLGNKGYGPAIGAIVMLTIWFIHVLAILKKVDKEDSDKKS